MNLALILRNHAQRRPKHPAIISRDRSISYAEFDSAVDGVAGHLLKSGVSSGDIVAVALKDSPEHMIALFAVARMGAIILPIDRRWTGGEKQRTIEHFQAKVILVESEDETVPGDVPPLTLDDLGNVLRAKHEKIVDFEQAGLPLVVSLSSGTTGRPKGPLLTHENFFARFQIYYVSLTLNEHDRFACTSPLYFSGSRGFSMCVLYAGATLVLLPPPVQTRELIREINDHGCTSAFVVPTIIRRLVAANEGEGLCFPNMRVLLSTGTVLFPEDRDIALKKVASNILNFYGSAEGGGVSVLGPHHPPEARQSAGAIVFGSSVRVVDDDFRDLKPGAIGRICYRSPGSAKEFYRDSEATAQSFRDGWYFPGDLGYIDENGFVFITGRIKDLIIRAGVNIYPNEIESILLAHEAVREVAVVGVPSKEFGEEVVAYVVADSTISPEALRNFCTRNLAPYKVPTSFYFTAELPRTSVGKIDKRLLGEKLPASDDEAIFRRS